MEFFSRLRTKIHNWKICHRPIMAEYPRILYIGNYAMVCFCHVSTHFSCWALEPAHFTILIRRLPILLFSFIIKVDYSLSVKGYCVYLINKVVCRYGISFPVFNPTSHSLAALTRELSRWTFEEKFHIYPHPCIILHTALFNSYEVMFALMSDGVCDLQIDNDNENVTI